MLKMIWCKGFTDIRRCKLCQDGSEKGIKFRKQFGLDAIPACPFKGKSAKKPVPYVRTQEAAKVVEKDHYDTLPRVMSMKLWQETVDRFDKDDPRYPEVYGLHIWLAGVGKTPGRDSVCDKRAALMWDLRKYAIGKKWVKNKILLVGNADIPLTADLGDYDHIGIFNEPRKKELLNYATHHFMRSNKKDLSHHGGEEYIGKTSAQIVLCDGGEHAKGLQKKFASLKIFLAACRSYATDYPAASLGKAPSTGYGMLKMYKSWGWDVTLACFTWEGLKVHNWEFERKSCLKMVQNYDLRVVDSKLDQLTLAPMQMSSVPKVKKPCGCKDKKGA